MPWQKGPIPPQTFGWGGVVLPGEEGRGFHFADFCGDHVQIIPDNKDLKPDEVVMWNNGLEMPPMKVGRIQSLR